MPIYEQSVFIRRSVAVVDRTITEAASMARWLNPLLVCEPVGEWSTGVGSRFCFRLKVPFEPTLECRVRTRRDPGLVEWEFDGFFTGTDRWECFPQDGGTLLVNRFAFDANPLVRLGFRLVAEGFTRRDMQAQLERLRTVAEHAD